MASTEDFFKPKPQQEAKQKADIYPPRKLKTFSKFSPKTTRSTCLIRWKLIHCSILTTHY